MHGYRSKNKQKVTWNFWNSKCISMHPLKSLNVMGDGGAVVTNNKKFLIG